MKDPGGRPQTPKAEIDAVAEAMEKWSEDENAYSLTHFIADAPDHLNVDPAELSKWAKRHKSFEKTLRKVKARISRNRDRLASEGKIPKIIWQRSAHAYDCVMIQADDEEKDKDMQRKIRENSSMPQNAQSLSNESDLIKENQRLKQQLAQQSATQSDDE